MLKLEELEITYMGKNCTIQDYVDYKKDIRNIIDLSKIGVIVYIDKIVKNIRLSIDEMCFDGILEYLQFNMDECNFLAIKVINDLKIKELPISIKQLFESKDEDEKYDLFVQFLRSCNIS
jgi:hypothetical protein